LPNYTDDRRRLGFTDDDFVVRAATVVDALVAWGDVETVRKRVKDHLDAGADQVCIQVFDVEPCRLPSKQWRTLAMAMLASALRTLALPAPAVPTVESTSLRGWAMYALRAAGGEAAIVPVGHDGGYHRGD